MIETNGTKGECRKVFRRVFILDTSYKGIAQLVIERRDERWGTSLKDR
jgi:hypothetical protein